MRQLEQTVFPRWQASVKQYGFAGAFDHFGPYQGAGITITTIDLYTVESSMTLNETNTNYVGTHFGGSLYSMCDPFFMFILMENLGPDYIVWDKAATIEFIKPGLGKVTARFHISAEAIAALKGEIVLKRKTDKVYECNVTDAAGSIVAKMTKTLYIRAHRHSKS